MCLFGTSLEGCKCIFLCLFCVCFESVFVLLGLFALVLFVCVLLWKGFIMVVPSLCIINCACFDLLRQSSVCVFFNLWAKAQCACVFQPLSQSSVCVCFSTFEPELSVRVFQPLSQSSVCVCFSLNCACFTKFRRMSVRNSKSELK